MAVGRRDHQHSRLQGWALGPEQPRDVAEMAWNIGSGTLADRLSVRRTHEPAQVLDQPLSFDRGEGVFTEEQHMTDGAARYLGSSRGQRLGQHPRRCGVAAHVHRASRLDVSDCGIGAAQLGPIGVAPGHVEPRLWHSH